MKSKINVNEKISNQMFRKSDQSDLLIPIKGLIGVDHIRGGRKIWSGVNRNLIVNTGKNYLLNTGFAGDTAISSWYIGLINNSPTPTLLVTNTASTGTRNWVEIDSDYDETNRPSWGTASTSSQTMTNASTADFTFNGSVAVYGIFIISDDTKGGETGTLWAAGAFSSVRNVINGDVLKVTYTASM